MDNEIKKGEILGTKYELVIKKTMNGTIAEKVEITFKSLESEKLFEIRDRNEAEFYIHLNTIFVDGFSHTNWGSSGWFGLPDRGINQKEFSQKSIIFSKMYERPPIGKEVK